MCDKNSTYGLHSLPGVSDCLHVRPELDLWVALTPGGCQIGHTCDQNSTYGLHSLPGGVRLVTWYMDHSADARWFLGHVWPTSHSKYRLPRSTGV
jgi:hypothetical protein